MRKTIVVIVVVILCGFIACKKEGQKVANPEKVVVVPSTPTDIDLAIEDESSFIVKYDFAPFFKKEYNGVFGNGRQPIKIFLSNLEKSKEQPSRYDVEGFSVHKKIKVPFRGTLKLDKVLKINNAQISVMISYEFTEQEAEHGNGKFVGNGIAVKSEKGQFSNSNFIGTYDFENGESIICNFK
ncbi:MAG: hypothetical protein HRT68_06735 [Flavobacteriaceae bacterium]|nr:hypothetical protein [Flavobacteriaceae bacterium]